LISQTDTYRYEPDYAVSPGQVLEEIIESQNIKKGDLADKCGLSSKTMSLILNGRAPISAETAIQLERVVGIPASTWSSLEADYRLFQAKLNERKQLIECQEWLQHVPVSELVKRGIIQRSNTAEMIEQLLTFYGVGSIRAWDGELKQLEATFRRSTSFISSPEAIMTWLRIAELRGLQVTCESYKKAKFEKILSDIRSLSCDTPDVFGPKMKNMCAQSGVALVFIKELPKTHVCGATRWLSSNKALLALSLRYKTDDQLWFSFFHEAGHILLHGKKNAFVDEVTVELNVEEEEANQFAAELLIPPSEYERFINRNEYTPSAIRSFAEEINVSPGIVVGRLQHDNIIPWRSQLNHLKLRLRLKVN